MKSVAILLIALTGVPASSQEIYDLLLKGGHVIDPKNARNGRMDIAITSGKIRRVAPDIPAAQARNIVSATGYFVTPGLIDLHASVYPQGTPSGIDADHNTLRFGVTTVADAGSSTPKTFEQFHKAVVADSTVRVLAFLAVRDASEAGSADQLAKKYPQVIVGVRNSANLAASMKTVLMADAGTRSPSRSGDIETKVFAPDAPRAADLQAARTKGVLFDVGHGADGFAFRTASAAIKQGFLPDTISTGLDSRSVLVPRPTMTAVLSRFLALGLTLEQVIERTTVNPARAIKRPDLGSMDEGGIADIAVFEMRKGRFGFVDGERMRLTADRELRCVLTIRSGKIVWDTEGLSLTDWQNAGPYSNFK